MRQSLVSEPCRNKANRFYGAAVKPRATIYPRARNRTHAWDLEERTIPVRSSIMRIQSLARAVLVDSLHAVGEGLHERPEFLWFFIRLKLFQGVLGRFWISCSVHY